MNVENIQNNEPVLGLCIWVTGASVIPIADPSLQVRPTQWKPVISSHHYISPLVKTLDLMVVLCSSMGTALGSPSMAPTLSGLIVQFPPILTNVCSHSTRGKIPNSRLFDDLIEGVCFLNRRSGRERWL